MDKLSDILGKYKEVEVRSTNLYPGDILLKAYDAQALIERIESLERKITRQARLKSANKKEQ